MLLQRLAEYADRLDLPPALYVESPVRYVISLAGDGRLLTLIDTADPKNRATRRGEPHAVPQVQRSGTGAKPLLLADNAEYTLGLARETSKAKRVAQCHAAYLELLERCAAATGEPAVAAVRTFLTGDPLGQLELPADFDRGATITFRVDGHFVVDLPAVRKFWVDVNDPDAAPDQPAPVMQCVVCREQRPVLRRLQAKLKGVPGGQAAGTALISANEKVFESYGLEASLIAPTCAACGERFTKGANALLADTRQRIVLGGAAFIYWTRERLAYDIYGLFDQPRTEDVRALLDSVGAGRLPPDVELAPFYATVLSGNGGRAVVRDWLDTTLGEVLRHITSWFRRQEIVALASDERRYFSLRALAAATVRDARTDLPTTTTRALWRAALADTPLPMDLLYEAVRRNRAEQRVTAPRAALIKLVLLSGKSEVMEDEMVRLDPARPEAAYHCGRLLAVLEAVQRLAIPNAKATIIGRFFGTASSAPASVFGGLLRGTQAHLMKLQRDRYPAYVALQGRIEEVLASLDRFPRTLSLEEQGLFSLGYYHQRAYDRAQARAAAERRRRGEGEIADALPLDAVEPDTETEEE